MKRLLSVVFACAMVLSVADLKADYTEGFESGTFGAFSTLGSSSILNSTFGVTPQEGNFMAGLNNSTTRLGGSFSDRVIELALGLNVGDLDTLIGADATRGAAMTTSVFLNSGESAFFRANFLTNEALPDPDFNDFAFFSVVDSSGTVVALSSIADTFSTFSASSASDPSFGSFASETGWFDVSFTVSASDTYQIGFGVMNVMDTNISSALLVDTIPEPSSAMYIGLLGVLALTRNRRKRS